MFIGHRIRLNSIAAQLLTNTDSALACKMKIKCLPLDWWMTEPWAREGTVADKDAVEPKFNRPGIYLIKDECWFETPDGLAYKYSATQFKYALELLHVRSLNYRQAAALHAVVDQKLATKKQRKLLQRYQESMHIVSILKGYDIEYRRYHT